MLYREIEEAVAFVAAYFYYKLPRRQVDVFSERLANALLRCYRSQKEFEEACNSRCAPLRELVIEINAHGRIAIVIVEAASIFNISLQQVSALLPNNVQLHITADSVCYSVRSSRICLYRADGNMYHFHRGAHHTKMRPPLTLTNEDDEDLRKFTVSMHLCDTANDQFHDGGNCTAVIYTSSPKYDPRWGKTVQRFVPAENRITSSVIMHNRTSVSASYFNLARKSTGGIDAANGREISHVRSPCDDTQRPLTTANRTRAVSRFEIVHGHKNNVYIRRKSKAIARTEQMCTSDTSPIQWKDAAPSRELKPRSKPCRKPSCQKRYVRRINTTHALSASETRSEQRKELAHESKSTSIIKEESYRSRTEFVDGTLTNRAKDAETSRNFDTDDILRSLGVFAGENLAEPGGAAETARPKIRHLGRAESTRQECSPGQELKVTPVLPSVFPSSQYHNFCTPFALRNIAPPSHYRYCCTLFAVRNIAHAVFRLFNATSAVNRAASPQRITERRKLTKEPRKKGFLDQPLTPMTATGTRNVTHYNAQAACQDQLVFRFASCRKA
uniref:Anti-proliferative protein domain-containing protein n=1 Tax=Ascaris lumbricoides TaxID=6252 RepID=A0A9J2Q8M4_ASCLU